MPILSQIIINICMLTADPKCSETLHVCVRDTFKINFFDTLTEKQEHALPFMVNYCEAERKLTNE